MRVGIDAAPAGLNLRQHFLATLDDRLIKGPRAMNLFQQHSGHDIVRQKGGLAIGNLVFQCDPQMCCNRLRRRKLLPVANNSCLHPLEIAGIIHVSHEINVSGFNGNSEIMWDGLIHLDVP